MNDVNKGLRDVGRMFHENEFNSLSFKLRSEKYCVYYSSARNYGIENRGLMIF